MNNHGGPLSFEAYIGDKSWKRTIKSMTDDVQKFTGKVKTETDKIDTTFSQLGRVAAGAFAGLQLAQLPGQIVKVRGEFQQLEIALSTMLGSKEKADRLMADVTKFAAQTPYGLKDTAAATKQLLAFGESADTVIGTLRKLGDIASGIGAPLGDIAYLYGTTMTQGRLYTQDLNQFLGRGIPMIKALADVLGVAESKVKEMVESGKVGFPEVQKAIDNLTKSGSMFGGLMEAQSKSLLGLQAALGDAVDSMLNDIGKSQEGVLTTIFETAISAVENYEQVVDVLKVVIATYGAYRAALMLTAAVQAAPAFLAHIKMWYDLTRAVKSAKDAQILFNLASRANPYVLVATAIVGMVTAYTLFNKEVDEATKLTERINSSITEETSKVKALAAQIKDQNIGQAHRADKLKELIALSPDHLKGLNLENVATEQGAKLIDEYVESLAKKIKLQEYERELTESLKREEDARAGKSKLSLGERFMLAMETSANQYNQDNGQRYVNRLKQKEIELNETIIKQEKTRQEEIKELIRITAEGGTITKKPYAPPAAPTDTVKKQKQLSIKTFQDELNEKRAMYELYERWIQHVGREAAEEQFKDLRKGGDNYIDWLNREIKRLEQLRDFQYAAFTGQDRADLDVLLTERGRLQGQKTGLEAFKSDLDAAKDSAESLVDYLQYLEAVQRGLEGDDSILGREKALLAATEKVNAEKRIRSELDNFLKEIVGSEEKRLEIQNKYATLRAGLEQKYANEKTEAYQKALDKINKAEADEYDQERQKIFEASKEYRALVRGIEDSKSGGLARQIAAQKKLVDAALAAGGESYEEYIAAYQELIRLQKKLAEEQKVSAEIIMNFAGRLGQALSQFDGELGNVGRTLAEVASVALDVNKILDKNATATEKWGSAAEIVGTIISNIARISKERKDAEADYYRSVIAYQNQYNLALIEQTRIGSESVTTVWGTSFADKIKGAQEAIIMANDELSNVLTKLEEVGKVKVGTETKSAWESIVAGAVSGAVYGGIAGAGVFSAVGAIIGAVGGAIVGWLTGRKSEDIYGDLETVVPGLIKENAAGIKELDVALARSLMDAGLLNDETRLLLQNAIDIQEEINGAKQQIEGVISELVGQMGQDLRGALVGAFIEGQSAALAWGGTVEKVLENIIEQMAYAATIKPFLDKYTQQLTDAVASKDYIAITDIMGEIAKTGVDVGQMFYEIMAGAKDAAKAQGMSLWDSKGRDDAAQAAFGSRISATEETVSVLAGQFNAVRIFQAELVNHTRIMVPHLATIAANTSFNRNLVFLEDIKNSLSRLEKGNSNRGYGL